MLGEIIGAGNNNLVFRKGERSYVSKLNINTTAALLRGTLQGKQIKRERLDAIASTQNHRHTRLYWHFGGTEHVPEQSAFVLPLKITPEILTNLLSHLQNRQPLASLTENYTEITIPAVLLIQRFISDLTNSEGISLETNLPSLPQILSTNELMEPFLRLAAVANVVSGEKDPKKENLLNDLLTIYPNVRPFINFSLATEKQREVAVALVQAMVAFANLHGESFDLASPRNLLCLPKPTYIMPDVLIPRAPASGDAYQDLANTFSTVTNNDEVKPTSEQTVLHSTIALSSLALLLNLPEKIVLPQPFPTNPKTLQEVMRQI